MPLLRVRPPDGAMYFFCDVREALGRHTPSGQFGVERCHGRVPPGKHRVEISYVGLSMADPEKVRYRYQLKGFDANWVEAGREAKAVYTNVAPGKYEFRVITAREGGAWSEDGSALTIEQQPHFYETVWFRVVASLTIILAGLAVYRARIAQLNAQGVRLQQMVDEVIASLTQYNNRTPMGRVGEVDEIASVVQFLVSDRASYITATTVTVDGGWTAWGNLPL